MEKDSSIPTVKASSVTVKNSSTTVPKPTTTTPAKQSNSNLNKTLNKVQFALDVVGFIPGFGEVADGLNALIYVARGDKLNAALSAAAMIPVVGAVATGAKLVKKTVKAVEAVDDVYDTARGIKQIAKGGGNGDILFGQKSVSQNFSKTGNLKGESINSVADKLKSGKMSPDDLPIEYVKNSSGQKITVNNRSLTALSKADMYPTVVKDVTANTKTVSKVAGRLIEMGGNPKNSIIIRGTKEVVKLKK